MTLTLNMHLMAASEFAALLFLSREVVEGFMEESDYL